MTDFTFSLKGFVKLRDLNIILDCESYLVSKDLV